MDASRGLQALQSVIAAYLHVRNTVPLAAITLEKPSGPPQEAARTVRSWEAALSEKPTMEVSATEASEIRAALWRLLDMRAVSQVADNSGLMFSSPQPPDNIRAYALADHVITMEQAYPQCCAASHFRWDIIWLMAKPVADIALPAVVKVSSEEPQRRTEPSDWLEPDPGDAYDRFAVQLEMDEARKVTKVYVGGRPKAATGRHSTAWVALCDYVRGFLIGSPITDVAGSVITEARKINEIAQIIGSPDVITVPEPAPQKDLCTAQAAVSWFLDALNQLPGAVTDTGGTSGGSREGGLRAKIRAGVTDPALLTGMLDPVWLQDLDLFAKSGRQLLALRIALHLYITGTAYPQLARDVELVSEATLAELLFGANANQEVADEVCAAVLKALPPGRGYDQEAYASAIKTYKVKSALLLDAYNSQTMTPPSSPDSDSQTGSPEGKDED
jgi:hypothetical protein